MRSLLLLFILTTISLSILAESGVNNNPTPSFITVINVDNTPILEEIIHYGNSSYLYLENLNNGNHISIPVVHSVKIKEINDCLLVITDNTNVYLIPPSTMSIYSSYKLKKNEILSGSFIISYNQTRKLIKIINGSSSLPVFNSSSFENVTIRKLIFNVTLLVNATNILTGKSSSYKLTYTCRIVSEIYNSSNFIITNLFCNLLGPNFINAINNGIFSVLSFNYTTQRYVIYSLNLSDEKIIKTTIPANFSFSEVVNNKYFAFYNSTDFIVYENGKLYYFPQNNYTFCTLSSISMRIGKIINHINSSFGIVILPCTLYSYNYNLLYLQNDTIVVVHLQSPFYLDYLFGYVNISDPTIYLYRNGDSMILHVSSEEIFDNYLILNLKNATVVVNLKNFSEEELPNTTEIVMGIIYGKAYAIASNVINVSNISIDNEVLINPIFLDGSYLLYNGTKISIPKGYYVIGISGDKLFVYHDSRILALSLSSLHSVNMEINGDTNFDYHYVLLGLLISTIAAIVLLRKLKLFL